MATTAPQKPTIIDKYLHVAQDGQPAVIAYFNKRYDPDSGATGAPKFIVLHIQQGTSRGSWEWFHVHQASATVFANRDGSIWRLVPEEHGPWTNGDTNTPSAAGQRLVDLPGNNNIWSLTIETEGYSYTGNPQAWAAWPKPEAQINAVVWQIIDWMTRYKIPATNVLRHADINSVTRSDCPGNNFFAEVMSRVQAITNTAGATVTYAQAQPVTINGKAWDGKADALVNGLTFHADNKTVTAIKTGAFARQWASTDAELTRAIVPGGEQIKVLGWVKGELVNKEDRWWVTPHGSRIHVLATVERPTEPTQPSQPDENPFDKVVNGVRFHAATTDGTPRTVTVATEGTKVYKYATVTSAEVRAPLTKGEKIQAAYWVEAEPYNGDDRWWVTKWASRVPVSATVEKP